MTLYGICPSSSGGLCHFAPPTAQAWWRTERSTEPDGRPHEAAARKPPPAFIAAFKIRRPGFKVQLCHLVVVSLGEAYSSSLGLVSSSVK